MIELTVITPCFNEEEIIKDTILANIETLRKFKVDYEQLIVNDASSDGTAKIIEDLSKMDDRIICIHNSKNLGFGGAIKKGISFSNKQYILCIPADNPLDESILFDFIKNVYKADVVVGYREARLGYSPFMLVNSVVYHWLISLLFGMKLRDYNWIHMYKREIFASGNVEVKSDGIFMLAEVLIRARDAGYSIIEININQKMRLAGEASASKILNIIKTAVEMFGFYLSSNLGKRLVESKKVMDASDNTM